MSQRSRLEVENEPAERSGYGKQASGCGQYLKRIMFYLR